MKTFHVQVFGTVKMFILIKKTPRERFYSIFQFSCSLDENEMKVECRKTLFIQFSFHSFKADIFIQQIAFNYII